MSNLPTMFDSEEDALAVGKDFRDHVENMIRGDRKRRTHAWAPPLSVTVPRQLQMRKRAIRIVAKVIQRRREYRQLKAQRDQGERRNE